MRRTVRADARKLERCPIVEVARLWPLDDDHTTDALAFHAGDAELEAVRRRMVRVILLDEGVRLFARRRAQS